MRYTIIGLITITLWPMVYERPTGSANNEGEIIYKWIIGKLNVTKAIDEIYKQAKEMGADAITRFDVRGIQRIEWKH